MLSGKSPPTVTAKPRAASDGIDTTGVQPVQPVKHIVLWSFDFMGPMGFLGSGPKALNIFTVPAG